MDYRPELEGTLAEPIPRMNIAGLGILAALLMLPLLITLWVYA